MKYIKEIFNFNENKCIIHSDLQKIKNWFLKRHIESDSGDEQKEGFILDDWYKSFEFEIIGNENENSIMMKKLE